MDVPTTPESRTHVLGSLARAAGFGWFAVARAASLDEDAPRLAAWLAAGCHGEMRWLARETERRIDPRLVVEGCRSVVVLGLNYLRPDGGGSGGDAAMGLVSRYARTRDYHRVIEKSGRALARRIGRLIEPGASSRLLVDHGPAMERAWARIAGVGFVGKNTMLIHPREGSFHFLALILTTADLAPTPIPDDRSDCGDCRKCLDACPTAAITEPFRVDARKCLSYLTIEKRGPVEEEFWDRTEGWVFGCDICQDVCPYNRVRAPFAPERGLLGPAIVPGRWPLAAMIAVRAQELESLPLSSPLRRAGPDALARNAAIASTTHGGRSELAALKALAADGERAGWLRDLAGRCAKRLEGRLAGGAP